MPRNPADYTDELGQLNAAIESINDTADAEKRELSAEELEKWNGLCEQYQLVKRRQEQAHQAQLRQSEAADKANGLAVNGEEREAARAAALSGRQEYREAFANGLQAWCRNLAGLELEDRHKQACAQLKLDPTRREISIRTRAGLKRDNTIRQLLEARGQAEQRANVVGTTTAGGFTAPEDFQRELEIARLTVSGMREAASIMVTADGNDKPLPMMNDTSNVGEYLSENATIGSTVDLAFTQYVFKAHKLSSKLFTFSPELLSDSAFNLEMEIAAAGGERMGRAENTAFTLSETVGEPNGIVPDAAAHTGSGAAISYDVVIDLEHDVDRAYRVGASFMCNDLTVAALRKLKDSQGQYLWQPSLQAGVPATLSGYPVIINNDMASSGSSAKVLMFGNFQKYRIREVSEIRIKRFDELFAQNDLIGFVMFTRHDGKLLDAGTNPVKHHALAA